MATHYWNARAYAAAMDELRRRAEAATARNRPPRSYVAFEDLAIYCCGHGKDIIMVHVTDPRVAGSRQLSMRRAFYKE